MRRMRDKGVSTLMITAILLMVALVVTMGIYKALFYQFKRSQNEVKTRQHHWLAEGAIECAFAQFRVNNNVPDIVTDCGSGQGVIATFTPSSYGEMVAAHSGYSAVKKEILISNRAKSGAMQSSADLFFYSSATFSTPDPGELTNNGWECVALRYRNRFYAPVIDNKGVVHGKKPYERFDNPTGRDCAHSHRTRSASWQPLGRDFVRDEKLSLFEQFFNVPPEEYDKVKQREMITVIEGSGIPKVVQNCGQAIASHIGAGYPYLWIEGSCEITQSEYNNVVNSSAATDGVLVLVHDGVLSLMGKPNYNATEKEFKGVLFHFNTAFVAHPSHWRGFQANAFINHVPSVIDESYRTIASYYQHGAFTFSGGQYFDTTGQAAVFYDSLDFRFNSDVIDSVQANINTPKWKQGSWYAQ